MCLVRQPVHELLAGQSSNVQSSRCLALPRQARKLNIWQRLLQLLWSTAGVHEAVDQNWERLSMATIARQLVEANAWAGCLFNSTLGASELVGS